MDRFKSARCVQYKGKAFRVQGGTGHEGFRWLRLPDFKTVHILSS